MKGKVIPPYGKRLSGFVPTDLDDFGDGGAYPEIHLVQYPLNMGRPGVKSSAVVSVTVDAKGEVSYDAIVKQGANQNKLVQSTYDDVKEKVVNKDSLALPDASEEDATAAKTKAALEAIINGKINSKKPITAITSANAAEEPTYIRYTPAPDAPGYNPAAKQRVIRMVEAQVDPMEPPKHKHMKVPKGPGSPPVPVLHSPPRKTTVEDIQAWKVPPCISNWKNARGFTIPLDKRLAADGRGLQDVTINNKFAMLSEALYVSERKATEDLRIRSQIRKKMSLKEKEDKEAQLRDIAARARMERAGVLPSHIELEQDRAGGGGGGGGGARDTSFSGDASVNRGGNGSSSSSSEGVRGGSYDDEGGSSGDEIDERARAGETEDERVARLQRERLRVERRKERERELRLENLKGMQRKNKADRDEGRDISEKIALGMHRATGKLSGDSMFDSRLFNQSAGLDSGFGGVDEYNVYSKALFSQSETSAIYRPKRDDVDAYGDADTQLAKLRDTSKFRPDKGFQGAEGGGSRGGRDAPVQFELAKNDTAPSDDVFGIDDLVTTKRPRHD